MPRNSYMLPLDTTLQSHIEAGDLAGAFRLAELFSVRSTSSHEPSAGPPGERFAGLFCAHLPDDGGPLLLADGDEVRPEQISRRRVLLEPVPDGEGRGRLRVWWMAEYRDGVPPSVHDGHLKSAPSRVTSITFEAPEDILR